jgi:hypothetical protein
MRSLNAATFEVEARAVSHQMPGPCGDTTCHLLMVGRHRRYLRADVLAWLDGQRDRPSRVLATDTQLARHRNDRVGAVNVHTLSRGACHLRKLVRIGKTPLG